MKIFFLLIGFIAFVSCQNESNTFSSKNMDDKSELLNDNSTCDGSFLFTWPEEFLYWPEELDWAVKLKLKTGLDDNNLLSEDLEIKSLLLKYDVTISPSWWIPNSPYELYLYYDVKGKGIMSVEIRENVINDLLKTKKFESDVYIYEITHLDDSYIFIE